MDTMTKLRSINFERSHFCAYRYMSSNDRHCNDAINFNAAIKACFFFNGEGGSLLFMRKKLACIVLQGSEQSQLL